MRLRFPGQRPPSLTDSRLSVRRHVPLAGAGGGAGGDGPGRFCRRGLHDADPGADDAETGAIAREELKVVTERLAQLRTEHERAQAALNAADGMLKVEKSAVAKLTEDVGRLEGDNARLRVRSGLPGASAARGHRPTATSGSGASN
jgi:hypothetical protein